MPEGSISPELRILEEAITRQWEHTQFTEIKWDQVLHDLNKRGWFLVDQITLDKGHKFTNEEIHRIRMMCIDTLEDVNIQDKIDDQDWAAVENEAGRLARCRSILEKVGYQ